MMKRITVLFAALLFLCLLSAVSQADEIAVKKDKTTWKDVLSDVVGHYPIPADNVDPKTGRELPKNWEFSVGMQRYLDSHTSYEIGNNDPPFQKPLSRLVFPMDTWWLDLRARRTCPRWSMGLKSGFRLNKEADGRMTDSDWEDTRNTEMLTTFSESACRLERGFHFRADVDMNISDWLKLPASLEIRPLFAVQFQRLVLTDHDGVQWRRGAYDDDDEMSLDDYVEASAQPDPMISFRQDWYLYQIGVRGSYSIKLCKYLDLKANGEIDWGPAVGFNEDHHMLREGDLYGYIKSSGNSMYYSTGLDLVIAKRVSAGIIVDYSWIRTDGETRHYNAPLGQDFKWTDGVKAWSDQFSLIGRISCEF